MNSMSYRRKIKNKTVQWFGHVVRKGEDTNPRQIIEVRPEGRRTRGRSRKLIWMAYSR